MTRHRTPVQANCPIPEDFVALANRLRPMAVNELLRFIWEGFDRLAVDMFDVTKGDENLEDDITYAAFCRIQDSMPPYSPFSLIHQPRERERKKDRGQMPTSDLGFRVRGGNIRSHFSVEAKVIRTEGTVSRYVNEVKDNLLTGRYSTFSSEAVMLGYLLSGSPVATFGAIAASLDNEMKVHPGFASRNQRYSDHNRTVANASIVRFRCHHLLILFATAARSAPN
ncbi:MAG: hypothetical protein ABFE13_04135 [Phycisphaerales bacterium]